MVRGVSSRYRGVAVNPHMRTTSLCKNKRSEICIFRHFCIWGSPYANFSCTKCEQIPICESPYANKYCSNTPKTNFLHIWDPRMHNEVVRIQGLTWQPGKVLGCAFRRNSAGFRRKLAKSHRHERNVKVRDTGIQ